MQQTGLPHLTQDNARRPRGTAQSGVLSNQASQGGEERRDRSRTGKQPHRAEQDSAHSSSSSNPTVSAPLAESLVTLTEFCGSAIGSSNGLGPACP